MKQFFEQLEEIRKVKATFAGRGWFFGTSGNLSARVSDTPVQFLVTRSGIDKNRAGVNDFILCDEGLQSLFNPEFRPSLEASLHTAIYSVTAAQAVLHVHTLANNIVSNRYVEQGGYAASGLEIIKAFDVWEDDAIVTIPIIHNYGHIPTLTEHFAPHIKGDAGAILIAGHGITAWGRSVFEAQKVLEAWEFIFQYEVEQLKINS
ncbi:MAG: methylthioribulose 1-phosphate dehydratase [Bacilli bacterium]